MKTIQNGNLQSLLLPLSLYSVRVSIIFDRISYALKRTTHTWLVEYRQVFRITEFPRDPDRETRLGNRRRTEARYLITMLKAHVGKLLVMVEIVTIVVGFSAEENE